MLNSNQINVHQKREDIKFYPIEEYFKNVEKQQLQKAQQQSHVLQQGRR